MAAIGVFFLLAVVGGVVLIGASALFFHFQNRDS